MRFPMTGVRFFAGVFVVSAVLAASTRSPAQDVVDSDAPIDTAQHHPLHRGWNFFRSRPAAIPRTYSYYYDTWFNQPRHFRITGPDGKTYWRTTVRDLPVGTPWPSHQVIETH